MAPIKRKTNEMTTWWKKWKW